jgi:hypothetical protein
LIAKMIVGAPSAGPAPAVINPTGPLPFASTVLDRVLSAEDIEKATRMAKAGDYHREFHFKRRGGQWTINGETWDTFKIAADNVGHNTW